MFWAERIGLERIVDGLRALEADHGKAFTPAAMLLELAEKGGAFGDARTSLSLSM